MTNLTIPNRPPEEPAQDFHALREEALETLQHLAGETWTDHNLHDPGITMLEAMCYAITDLGYRLDFPIPDLVAKEDDSEPDAFPQPRYMLPCQPVTKDDFRRLILDIPGVRNALLQQATPSLWHIDVIPDAHLDSEQRQKLAEQVRERFLASRNLGEDLEQLRLTPTYDVVLRIKVELKTAADPVETLAHLFSSLADIIAPRVRFYSQDALEREGYSRELLLTGPWLNRGFLPDKELARPALVDRVYVADLMSLALETDGVSTLDELLIGTGTNPDRDDFEGWVYTPLPGQAPVLNIEQTLSRLEVSKDGTPINIPTARLIERYNSLRFGSATHGRNGTWQNTSAYRQLNDYLTLQHELPTIYGVGPSGIAPGEGPQRTSEVRQLQSYLLLFDQILGNQFSQLNHLRLLLSQPSEVWLKPLSELLEKMLNSENLSDRELALFWHTLDKIPLSYASQPVDSIDPMTGRGKDLQELPDILGDKINAYSSAQLQTLTEEPFSASQLQRLIRAGNHILARSHEQLPDAAQLRYEEVFKHYADILLHNRYAMPGLTADDLTQRLAMLKEVIDRSLFMRDVVLGGERGQGSNYIDDDIWGSGNISGLKQRVYRRLGLPTLTANVLSTSNTEGFHLVEDILLRHGIASGSSHPLSVHTVYLVAPTWPTRLADTEFRAMFLRTVEQELPAHLHPCWLHLGRKAMADFEKVYNAWRNAMTRYPSDQSTKPVAEQDQRRELVRRLSDYLHTFIHSVLTDGNSPDISRWDFDPAGIGSPTDGAIGRWAVGYRPIDSLNYDPDNTQPGRIGHAAIGEDQNQSEKPMVVHIGPANSTQD